VTRKPIVQRELAMRDIEGPLAHYLSEHAETAALDFIDSLEQAYSHISEYPATGTPRYAHELNLPGLRFWPITKYPHLVFYIEQSQHIDVWRVLHGERDIPVLMQENTESLMASDQIQKKA
jgi:toxin ParE1/3/4